MPKKEFEKAESDWRDNAGGIDQKYSSSVYRHFNGTIKSIQEMNPTGENEDDADYERFLGEAMNGLSKLADPKRREALNPWELSPGILQLATEVSTFDPEASLNKQLEGDSKELIQKNYSEAKDVFMASCQKAFPEIQVDSDVAAAITEELKTLSSLRVTLKGADAGGKIPESLLKMLGAIFDGVSDHARASVMKEHKKSGKINIGKEEWFLEIAKSLYRLQLIKDRLKVELEGREFEEQAQVVKQEDKKGIQEEKRKLEAVELQERLLEEISLQGRLGVHASVGGKMRKRGVNSGFQDVIDEKNEDLETNQQLRSAVRQNTADLKSRNIADVLKAAGINAVVTIAPLVEHVPIYKEKKVTTGFFFKRTETVTEEAGMEERPISAGQINANATDKEKAYRIFYYVVDTDENPYIEVDGHRRGNRFMGHIILPEKVAREAFDQIQKEPGFVKKILQTLDPDLMKEQESPRKFLENQRGSMPTISKLVVIPEGEAWDALEGKEGDPYFTERINPDYIKECEPY